MKVILNGLNSWLLGNSIFFKINLNTLFNPILSVTIFLGAFLIIVLLLTESLNKVIYHIDNHLSKSLLFD